MFKPLVKYTRDNKNHMNGVVVAIGKDQIGWSKCCKRDKFDKELALRIAFGRAHKCNCDGPPPLPPVFIPQSMLGEALQMLDRASRYYR